ncbi:hypothetical protein C731_1234 [Mycolicibacterium hassiacum DSM 44199]|uniref:Uncharacterized protein n=1 Tax=Mycolicibacterium hassiacum (strain DSM 44199 / CIP 105218 / JCM 12690 / 3849) TaxID=1122247 RepID=K5B932_MYCHD|nr:hypothetical protein C731_1234 [Mycolicibacterium hassiacum DSM 44199]MDA4086668.1 hypothetical protein [Mycolicibacterium hassiacum DSM 44199]
MTVHTEPRIGCVPAGVWIQFCEMVMSPIAASGGSGRPVGYPIMSLIAVIQARWR